MGGLKPLRMQRQGIGKCGPPFQLSNHNDIEMSNIAYQRGFWGDDY